LAIGFSRNQVKHLGGLSAVGINCASCHVVEIKTVSGTTPPRILGATSHFDVETFFRSVLVATFRTAELPNMKRFLAGYLSEVDPDFKTKGRTLFENEWNEQEQKIAGAISADPFASKGIERGALHEINAKDLQLVRENPGSPDLTKLAQSVLKVFHNMRAALHVPDQPPEKPPPVSGPGRNDAFGLLSAALLNAPQPYAPTKFGLVWNVDKRRWVHWDGNTQSPIARNLLASLGLGAPLYGKSADLEFALVKRQTDISEMIRAPRYPFKVDEAASKRGAAHFEAKCSACHGGKESDKRLYSVAEIGTDPHRAELFTERQAERFNKFLTELEMVGYQPPKEFGVRSTGKYWAASLNGVWARSPYLHNGSVRTMGELLTSPAARATSFRRGSRVFDEPQMGYTDEGSSLLNTAASGNSNSGHDYGIALSPEQKRDLIEYLKTL
jgi:cytochrome c553